MSWLFNQFYLGLSFVVWGVFFLLLPIVGYVEETSRDLGYVKDIVIAAFKIISFPLLTIERRMDSVHLGLSELLFVALVNSFILTAFILGAIHGIKLLRSILRNKLVS